MARLPGTAELEPITDARRAAVLLKPPRLSILGLAREPISATEVGLRLGVPRQRANYHVRELARSGFLKRSGRRRKGNMIEQQYVVAAKAWGLSPELLGDIGADWKRMGDTATPGYLFALAAQMQNDLARAMRAAAEGRGPATFSLKSQFRFESPRQREQFENALRQALVDVISRYTVPNLRADGSPGPGRPFRLVLGFYPYTAEGPEGRP